jgi:hypothetical protein
LADVDPALIRCILRTLSAEHAIRAEALRFDASGSYSNAIDLERMLQ